MVAIGLRLFGYRRVRDAVGGRHRHATGQDLAQARAAARLVRAAAAAAWTLPRPSCLTRSLVLERMLRRSGLAAELRIGVERSNGNFAAHAWVEHACVALAEPEDVSTRYAVFATVPDGPAQPPP